MFDLSLARVALASAYPELPRSHPGLLDRFANRAVGPMIRSMRAWRVRRVGIPEQVAQYTERMRQLTSSALRTTADEVRLELRRSGLAAEAVARSFALIRE